MIYTFYSYKGGVGRSMALANVAELFYRAGKNVLMVDWDLEAPGLERFFPIDMDMILDKPGIIDMLLEYKRQMSHELMALRGKIYRLRNLPELAIDIYPGSSSEGRLRLLTAGKRSGEHFNEYANAVLTFDWQDFYQNWEGELYAEWLRRQFSQMADIVLIDSRTGVTEIGGVCTYQLADTVVMFCSPNQQSVHGTYIMAQNFASSKVDSLRGGRSLEILVIPARIEDRAEVGMLNEFRREFLDKFSAFLPQRLALGDPDLLWNLRIPHVPYYAFDEAVAVRQQNKAFSQDMASAYQSLQKTMNFLALGSRFHPLVGETAEGIPYYSLDETSERVAEEVVLGEIKYRLLNLKSRTPQKTILDPKKQFFVVSIMGDSMSGAGIRHGDLLLVEKQDLWPRQGEIAVFQLGDTSVTVKRFYRKAQRIYLESDNPKYVPLIYSENSPDLRPIGVAVALLERED